MTRNAGINWVLGTFAILCVMQGVPALLSGEVLGPSTLPLVLGVVGLLFTIGAGQRDFWAFVGVIAICVTSVASDMVVLVAGWEPAFMMIMNALIYGVVAAALFTARRQFPRRRVAR